MKYNLCLRQTAKILFISMWNKFGQRLNKTHVKEIVDHMAFHMFLDSDKHHVRYVSITNSTRGTIAYCRIYSSLASLAVATDCTHTKPSNLGGRFLYYNDKESVIFINRPGEPDTVFGYFKDKKISKIKSPKLKTTSSNSLSHRNYRYKSLRDKIGCKVRCFSLNSEGEASLNDQMMKKNVQNEVQKPLKNTHQIQVI